MGQVQEGLLLAKNVSTQIQVLTLSFCGQFLFLRSFFGRKSWLNFFSESSTHLIGLVTIHPYGSQSPPTTPQVADEGRRGEITNYSPKNGRRAFSESSQWNHHGLSGVGSLLNNTLLNTGVNSYLDSLITFIRTWPSAELLFVLRSIVILSAARSFPP